MRKVISTLLISMMAVSAQAKDMFAGFYEGRLQGDPIHHYPLGMDREIVAEIFHGPEGYRIKILSDYMSRSDEHMIIDGLQPEGSKLKFSGEGYNGYFKLEGEVTGKEIKAVGQMGNDPISVEMKRVKFKSPTLGMKAPKGAKVLFDGKDTSAWAMNDGGGEINWKIIDGSSMLVANNAQNAEGRHINSTIHSKDAFKGPLRMHIEFKIPDMWRVENQARANSGIFFGPYEIQVLDSFGSPALWDNCGSIYRQTPPQVNACLEPEAWQTYDITYIPAEVKDGKQVKPALFTVYQNGVRIHNATEVWYGTTGPKSSREGFVPPQEIRFELQDHNDPVQFRNIWVEQL